ncbi:MAG: hypothetical protein M1829_005836 [Trizodia sp. TS-e1964]|nr:MAG: hypothetical protein M1829_005836 [Trizodia sp. TS-e1964]
MPVVTTSPRSSASGRSSTGHSSDRDESRNLDRDWVHDRFETGNETRRSGRPPPRHRSSDRISSDRSSIPIGAKLRVDNLHYDLTEEDLEIRLKDLFSQIGPVTKVEIRYDRAGRSDGTAFVTYESYADARKAIREYDGANAAGQPINLKLLPSIVPALSRPRNPFDTAQLPPRSLFERVSAPAQTTASRSRSSSPNRPRLSDVSKPPPEHIDRYVPGGRSPGRRSPLPRRGGTGGGRRPGERRDEREGVRGGGGGSNNSAGDKLARDGRPRKTTEELDAEMEDYWTIRPEQEGSGGHGGEPAVVMDDGDVDMIE